jgi:hypothetical protein
MITWYEDVQYLLYIDTLTRQQRINRSALRLGSLRAYRRHLLFRKRLLRMHHLFVFLPFLRLCRGHVSGVIQRK